MIFRNEVQPSLEWHQRRNTWPKERTLSEITGIGLHRIKGLGETADALAEAFTGRGKGEPGEHLGCILPYNFLVGPLGVVRQGLPITNWGWHMRSHSRRLIAIAVLGDFRTEKMSSPQKGGVVELCVELGIFVGGLPEIAGHDELPNGSNWPDHVCPGPGFFIDNVRAEIADTLNSLTLPDNEGARAAYGEAHLRRLGMTI